LVGVLLMSRRIELQLRREEKCAGYKGATRRSDSQQLLLLLLLL
jgi:hypothetical protein